MDAELVWLGILFMVAAVLGVVYFVFDQERKRIAASRDDSEDVSQ